MHNLMKAFAATVLAGAAIAPISGAQAETIRDPLMAFSIAFPGDAERADAADNLPDWVHRIVIWDQYSDAGYFSITAVQTLPDNYAYNDLPGTMSDARAQCEVGNDVVNERSFSVAGGMGVEVLTRRHGPIGIIYDLTRYAAKGNKFYCVSASYEDTESGKTAKAFVQSFKIL